MNFFKRPKSEIVKKAKEERIIYEAIYNFFSDDIISDEMITIGRVYHDGDDFETIALVNPYNFIFVVTYDSSTDNADAVAYKSVEVKTYDRS